MSMDLDRPLDEMISEKRKNRKGAGLSRRGGKAAAGGAGPVRGGGGGRPAAPRTQSAPVAGALTGAAPTLQQQLPQQTGQGSKIIVSNLPTDVTEPQIRELFASTVGPVTKVALSFDARGASKGVAQVEFKKNEDATKAFQQYNKRLIDQNRPMKVEIIVDPSRIPPPPLTTRVGPAPKAPKTPAAAAAASSTVAAAAGGRAAGGAKGKRGGRKGGEKPKPKTAADLDAEMEDYQQKKN